MKRESERRQRDKDKVGSLIGSNVFDHIAELNGDELNNYLLTYQAEPRRSSFSEDEPLTSDDQLCSSPSATKVPYGQGNNSRIELALKNISTDLRNGNPSSSSHGEDAHSLFQSNTARQILNELSSHNNDKQKESNKLHLKEMANQYKRNVPRKKKRHNTAPNSEGFNDYLERNALKHVRLLLN